MKTVKATRKNIWQPISVESGNYVWRLNSDKTLSIVPSKAVSKLKSLGLHVDVLYNWSSAVKH